MQVKAVELAKKADVVLLYIGLSYTTFEYSDLKVTDKEVMFTLKNTGSMDGAEVAQLYVSKLSSEIFRPAKELKGFRKVFLKVGESKTVTIQDGTWSGTLTMNDALCQMYYAKSGLARFVYQRLTNMLNKSMEKGKPNLNLIFKFFFTVSRCLTFVVSYKLRIGACSVCKREYIKSKKTVALQRIRGCIFWGATVQIAGNDISFPAICVANTDLTKWSWPFPAPERC